MDNKFGYQPDLSKMESYLKENEKTNGDYDGPTWWSIPNGMSSIRILPPWDATGRVALAVYSHPIEFQGKNMKYKKYSWTCVNKTFGKPCNICEGLESIKQSGVDISNYEPNKRTFYMNAIVMFDPDYDRDIKSGKKPSDCRGVAPGTHVLMRSPKTVYDWILSQITNPMVGDITSISNGIDIYVTREGQGLGTTYTTTLSPNGRQPVPQEYLDKITELYNLDDIFSTGFEKEQVDDLVNSLRHSSSAFNGGIQNMYNQMSGYTQVPQQQPYNPQVNSNQYTPSTNSTPFQQPVNTPFSSNGAPVPPPINPGTISQNNVTPPWENPAPAMPAQSSSDTPQCYGKEYNASNVKCVTCAFEIDCSNRSKV